MRRVNRYPRFNPVYHFRIHHLMCSPFCGADAKAARFIVSGAVSCVGRWIWWHFLGCLLRHNVGSCRNVKFSRCWRQWCRQTAPYEHTKNKRCCHEARLCHPPSLRRATAMVRPRQAALHVVRRMQPSQSISLDTAVVWAWLHGRSDSLRGSQSHESERCRGKTQHNTLTGYFPTVGILV